MSIHLPSIDRNHRELGEHREKAIKGCFSFSQKTYWERIGFNIREYFDFNRLALVLKGSVSCLIGRQDSESSEVWLE